MADAVQCTEVQSYADMCVGGGNKWGNGLSKYSTGNQKLKFCDMKRDLGVIMSADLKVGSQCNQACLSKHNVGSNQEIINYKVTRSLAELMQDNRLSAS